MEDEMAEDRKYVPNPRVAYGVFEGPTRFGKRVPGDAQVRKSHEGKEATLERKRCRFSCRWPGTEVQAPRSPAFVL